MKTLSTVRIAALSLTAAAAFMAATVQATPAKAPDTPAHAQRIEQRMAAHHTHRIEQLKTLLQLQPHQQAALERFAAATAPQARTAQAGEKTADKATPSATKNHQPLTTPERLDRAAQRRAAQQQRDDATRTFYAALTPAQQKVFDHIAAQHERRGRGKAHGKAHRPHANSHHHPGAHHEKAQRSAHR